MQPNIEKAAAKAVETLLRYASTANCVDPMYILEETPNVVMVSCDEDIENTSRLCEFFLTDKNQDAFTLVNRDGCSLHYIIVYNKRISQYKLRFALARELGHVILQHDGSDPEEIWTEEANCFAYHFLCPTPIFYKEKINFRPIRISLSWEMKEHQVFDSVDHMKLYVVEERNRINRYTGKNNLLYKTDDVELLKKNDYESQTGWRNCREVVLNGETIGYCGE